VKCPTYSTELRDFAFVPAPASPQLPVCLVCSKLFANKAKKASLLKKHFCAVHPDKADKPREFFEF